MYQIDSRADCARHLRDIAQDSFPQGRAIKRDDDAFRHGVENSIGWHYVKVGGVQTFALRINRANLALGYSDQYMVQVLPLQAPGCLDASQPICKNPMKV